MAGSRLSRLAGERRQWLGKIDNDIIRSVGNVGTKKTGKGRRKVGSKKRRMRAKIRHRK